jgi:hypothetical protein
MPVSKRGIKEECNQANHEREQQEALHLVKIAPTSRYWGPYSGIEDYELKARITPRLTDPEEWAVLVQAHIRGVVKTLHAHLPVAVCSVLHLSEWPHYTYPGDSVFHLEAGERLRAQTPTLFHSSCGS